MSAGATTRARLDVGELAHILSNARRRWVITTIEESPDQAVGLQDLADSLSVVVSGPSPDDDERKAAYVSLYQAHLPVLDDHGIVEFENREVRPGPALPVAVAAIDALAEIAGGERG